MTNDKMAETQARLTEIAALSLELDDLPAYIERIRSGPAADAQDHVDLALAVAALQRIAHRQLGPDDATAA